MSNKLNIKLHEDAENGKAFIGVTPVGKQALQKIEQTNPSFTGKTLPAIAKGIASDVVFNLSYNCNLSDDVEECFQRMLEFGLDDVYVLWSKGWTSIMIARKIMKTLNLTPTASNPQESVSKKNEEALKFDEGELKAINNCDFATLFDSAGPDFVSDDEICFNSQCDEVRITKIEEDAIQVDIDGFTAPAKKFLGGRIFTTYYKNFGSTHQAALTKILKYLGEVCQARDTESRRYFELTLR